MSEENAILGQETKPEREDTNFTDDLPGDDESFGSGPSTEGIVAKEQQPMSNAQKVLEWIGLYYALSTGTNPPWLTVDAGGSKEVTFNLGNWLLAGATGVLGYVLGRAGVAVGRVAVKTYTGV